MKPQMRCRHCVCPDAQVPEGIAQCIQLLKTQLGDRFGYLPPDSTLIALQLDPSMALHLADLIRQENVGYAAEVFRKNMEVAEILVKAREKEEKVEALELEVDEEPPLKKMKGVIDRAFNNFGNIVHGVPDHQVQNETDAYLTYIRTTDLSSYQTLPHGIFNTISFSRDHQRRFPTLYVMARQWFAPAATSASSGRTFGGCSHLVTRRRARRTPEHVELLIFVRSNMQYFPDFGPLEDQYYKLYNKKKSTEEEEEASDEESEED